MKLSFGMIFSIILIIIFIAFAFFAVKTFLGTGLAAQVTQFKEDLQSDIDRLWRASQGSQEEEYFLPNKIKYICFVDYSTPSEGMYSELYQELQLGYYGSENLFFSPSNDLQGVLINHIALDEITINQNPYCIPNTDSKIKLVLSKDFDDTLVTVSS